MKLRKGRRIMAALLCFSMLFGLFGCNKTDAGGRIDQTDHDAPKVIQSKEITEFYASFFLAAHETADGKHDFLFRIETEDDILTASEEASGLSRPADETLLTALQEVIDEQALVSQNGVYNVTAGLAPGHQKCELHVTYASGETLRFTVNNDPRAAWAEGIYDAFAQWFSEQGDDSLL